LSNPDGVSQQAHRTPQNTHHFSRLTQNDWAGQRILITGGTGFLGQRLTRRLVELGTEVTVALCAEENPAQVASLPEECERRDGDVGNEDQIRWLIKAAEPDYVFHLAAVGVNDPFIVEETALQVNVHGTLNIIRAARDVGKERIRRVIVAGTSYEYGEGGQLDPGNVYAASKVAAWAFCRVYYRAHGTPVVIVRPFNVYGPGQTERALIPSAIRAALCGQDFPATPGEQRRDFVFIDDVIDGFIHVAGAANVDGQSIDLGTGRATAVCDVVDRIFALCGGGGRPQIGALPYRPGMVWELVADAERTKRLTGWQARTGLDEGLKLTIRALVET
jgi:nucleoside-diphosphate-sugar epimerase